MRFERFWRGFDRGWDENQYYSPAVQWGANLDHILPDNMTQQSVAVHISRAQTFLLVFLAIYYAKAPDVQVCITEPNQKRTCSCG